MFALIHHQTQMSPGHIPQDISKCPYMSWGTFPRTYTHPGHIKIQFCSPGHMSQDIYMNSRTYYQDIGYSSPGHMCSRTYKISIDTCRTYTKWTGHIRESTPRTPVCICLGEHRICPGTHMSWTICPGVYVLKKTCMSWDRVVV